MRTQNNRCRPAAPNRPCACSLVARVSTTSKARRSCAATRPAPVYQGSLFGLKFTHIMGKRKIQKPRFLAIDLFCGAGGTTRGLIDAGGLVLAGIDKDTRCKATYEKNNKNKRGPTFRPKFLSFDLFRKTRKYPLGEQRVALQRVKELLATIRRRYKKIPLLLAVCAPCQPFTRLAKQKVSRHRRSQHARDRSLLLQSISFVKALRPTFIFSENVGSITSSKYGDVWKSFESSLKRLGYCTGSDVINAVNFGIPQNRKRSILLAVRRDNRVKIAKAKRDTGLAIPHKDLASRQITVRQAIGHLPRLKAGQKHERIPNHATRALSPINIRRLKAAVPGATNLYMDTARDKTLSLKCRAKVNRKFGQHCFTDVYTRMHPDRPSPTITTRCLSISNGRFGHFDVRQVRPISIREAAILQSFPSSYVFHPTNQLEPAARMIGNAVPPRLARFFAGHLLTTRRRPSGQ